MVARSNDAPKQFFFIVQDEAQKAQLLAEDNELFSIDPGRSDITVLVEGSREAELLQTEGAHEMSALGASYSISDMSYRAAAAVAQRQVSQADVMAGGLSTERAAHGARDESRSLVEADVLAAARSSEVATYGAGAAQPQREAWAEDIMAGVLSSELANFPAPAERTRSDADVADAILAGALSSEMALFGR
jgi:hypothetical protein